MLPREDRITSTPEIDSQNPGEPPIVAIGCDATAKSPEIRYETIIQTASNGVTQRFRIKNLSGRRFGRWTVISDLHFTKSGHATYWTCRCDCGITRDVQTATLINGDSRSCGCLSAELSAQRNRAGAKTDAERFWSFVDKSGECWVWTAFRNKLGYGMFGPRGQRPILSHRQSYILEHGAIPTGMCVLHRCDNPPCCNPAHLFIGDRKTNNKDMMDKGRHRALKGAEASAAKLTDERAREIRQIHSANPGTTHLTLAKQFGVSRATIYNVLKQKHWKDGNE